MLQLWNRLIKMSNDRLTKCVFNVDFEKSTGNKNWCSEVRDILGSIGEENAFTKKQTCDIAYCKQKMCELAEDEWKANVLAKPKLRSYKKFKYNMDTTDYVKWTTSKYDRSIQAKFRCGILQLHVETGRFNQTKLEDRICQLCNLNSIEDECHFLCECPLYNELRKTMYDFVIFKDDNFVNMSTEQKFIELMSNYNMRVCKYLKAAWDKRQSKLYN